MQPTDYMSETSKYRHLTKKYCYVNMDGGWIEPGCGIDIASQGDPVVPWAWQLDLPPDEFAYYNSNHAPRGPIQLRGHGDKLPIDSESLDFCYASHLLEDYAEEQWPAVFTEWSRVVKSGGHLIILIPEKNLWAQAIANGQCPNCSHKREGDVGLMSKYATAAGLEVIEDRLTNCFDGDYTLIGVFKKP